ncbi:MAG: hypothetical protein L0170_04580, partial [Acidobacteria bacterium]|nr:hypothetical protein [Acidobacteriota bacterium]
MNRPADPREQPGAEDEIAPPPSLRSPAPPPPGTDAVALEELRNAAATYDFLRRRGDPTQFWEILRLARSHRAIVAPL